MSFQHLSHTKFTTLLQIQHSKNSNKIRQWLYCNKIVHVKYINPISVKKWAPSDQYWGSLHLRLILAFIFLSFLPLAVPCIIFFSCHLVSTSVDKCFCPLPVASAAVPSVCMIGSALHSMPHHPFLTVIG